MSTKVSFFRGAGIIGLLFLALMPSAALAWIHGSAAALPAVPAQAAAAGFNTLTLNSTFNPAKFDMSGTNGEGYEWYLWNFFGTTPSNSGLTLNGDGSLTIAGLGGVNGQISSAATLGGGNWVGTAYGGGAYFEATLEFNSANVNTANGWPAWWTMAIEHLAGTSGQQWSGQAAGYSHFIEADVFEYDISSSISYGGTLHDWYGQSNCSAGTYCQVSSPSTRPGIVGTNWSVYHKLGLLWIPATSSTSGSATFYLDDVQQGSPVTWAQFTTQSPPPTGSTSWTWGIFDQQHVALIFGTGVNQFLTIQSVRVWQASSAGNIVQ